MIVQIRGWALTTTLSIYTLLKNALSKVSFSNLLTNDFLDHPKASENFFYFYTFDVYTFENYTFESVVVRAHTLPYKLEQHNPIESLNITFDN